MNSYSLIAGIAAAAFSGVSGYYFGKSVEHTEMAYNHAKVVNLQHEQYTKNLDKLMKENMILAKEKYELDAKHSEEMLDVQENIDAIISNTRTKRVYVRTKTRCPEVSGDKGGEAEAKAGSNAEEGRAELHPETVRRIIEIGKECDELAVDFNYLQEYVK